MYDIVNLWRFFSIEHLFFITGAIWRSSRSSRDTLWKHWNERDRSLPRT